MLGNRIRLCRKELRQQGIFPVPPIKVLRRQHIGQNALTKMARQQTGGSLRPNGKDHDLVNLQRFGKIAKHLRKTLLPQMGKTQINMVCCRVHRQSLAWLCLKSMSPPKEDRHNSDPSL